MSATLDYLSFMQHTDLISILDGRETVGNGNSGAGLHQSLQSVLDKTLTLCIESRSCLVKNQNRRILQDSSGYADTLTLTTREATASISDVGFKLVLAMKS